MEFNITFEMSLGLGKVSILASTLVNDFNEKIKNEDFGSSIKQIIISLVCVAPEYETFFKSRKTKFVKGKKIVKRHGTEYEIDSLLTYDIKLDYKKISIMSERDLGIELKKEFFNSISVIRNIKFDDFNFQLFEKECREYFCAYDAEIA